MRVRVVPTDEHDPSSADRRGEFLEYRARLQRAGGARDSALATIRRALELTREDCFVSRHRLLFSLAALNVESGRIDEALRAHIAVAGAAYEPDTTMTGALRALWKREHGTLRGLAEALSAERSASRHRLALEVPRVDRTLPDFALASLRGPKWTSQSLRGHVAVIEFWGTWCASCLRSLGDLQALYDRFSSAGVRFVTIDAEFAVEDLQKQREAVASFLRDRRLTFPTLLDLHGEKSQTLSAEVFPTTWVIDPGGRIRFEDSADFPGRIEVLRAQIESLLAAADHRRGHDSQTGNGR